MASPRLCKALLYHCWGSRALCQSQLAPHCPPSTACTQQRQQGLCTNSSPGTSTAAATAFHFTRCFVINHLPRVPVFQPTLPRCLVAKTKSLLRVYRTALPRLCPEVKDPLHGLTNPWLFCQLSHARGLKCLLLCIHPLGKQYERLNSFHIQHSARKTPEAGRIVAGILGTWLHA